MGSNAIQTTNPKSTSIPDKNECLTAVCPSNAQCVNTVGSWKCECLDGFTKQAGQCLGRIDFLLWLMPYKNHQDDTPN